jgi:2',3'-cyclic-nucleotide 2'-phosphodiesterase (5'-nucleotidase family)
MKYGLHLLAIIFLTSCASTKKGLTHDDGKISLNFVQVNDVYEIAPLSGGKEGGMARVATLKKKFQQQNPNTFLVMAGDFVSPSVYSSLPYEGRPIRGRQMIDAMNAAGMDLVIFGNHEFDIKESELQSRIDESNFQWISSNAFHKLPKEIVPFVKNGIPFPKTYILTIHDADGTTARIGFLGICLPFNKADYVSYSDPLATAKEMFAQLKDSVDAVVAITHQAIEDDEKLAKEIPGLSLILGGHEHDQRFEKIGKIYITKALANARSAFVVKMNINKKNGKIKVRPSVNYLDEKVSLDTTTNAVVQKWTEIANKNYASLGFDANKIVLDNGENLDGRETTIRNGSTNLTKLLVRSIKEAAPNADVVLFNSGSVRVDDILHAPITQYDIIRTLPFGGGLREVEMKGSLLIRILEQGKNNAGSGGFLQYNEELAQDTNRKWLLNNTVIDPSGTYRVVMAEFLLTGKEANLDFLSTDNPAITKVYEAAAKGDLLSDIRLTLIRYLEKR